VKMTYVCQSVQKYPTREGSQSLVSYMNDISNDLGNLFFYVVREYLD